MPVHLISCTGTAKHTARGSLKTSAHLSARREKMLQNRKLNVIFSVQKIDCALLTHTYIYRVKSVGQETRAGINFMRLQWCTVNALGKLFSCWFCLFACSLAFDHCIMHNNSNVLGLTVLSILLLLLSVVCCRRSRRCCCLFVFVHFDCEWVCASLV